MLFSSSGGKNSHSVKVLIGLKFAIRLKIIFLINHIKAGKYRNDANYFSANLILLTVLKNNFFNAIISLLSHGRLMTSGGQKSESASAIKQESIMTKFINRFLKDEEGATAIEYGLIAALIAVAIIAALQAVATSLSTNFSEVSSNLDAAA